VERTGGLLVMDDSFTRGVFMGSFKKVFGTSMLFIVDNLLLSFDD
jgi:hypothetical protein